MTVVGEAFINLKSGSASEFVKDATGKIKGESSKFEKAGEEAGTKFGTGFSKESQSKVTEGAKHLALKIGALIGGAFAIHEGISYVKDSLAVGEEANKTTAQTAAVIKSTGGAAKVTATQVAALSQSMADKTGQDHVAIQSAENLLLTFTNLHDEAGKGGKIFDRTSKAVLDLAAARHMDASAAAVQLGKAINDPAAGLAKLTRVGITFTQQQKDQIKWLQAKGDVMGAQNLILDQVNKKFGGSAEAQATSTDKMKVAMKELKESLGKAILPAIDTLLPAFSTAIKAIQPALVALGGVLGTVFKAIGPALSAAGKIIAPILGQIGKAVAQLAPVISPLVSAIGSIFKAFAPLLPVIGRVFAMIAKAVTPIIRVIGVVIGSMVKTVLPIINKLLDAFKPLLPVIGQIAGIIGGVLVKVFKLLAPYISSIAKFLGAAFKAAVPVILSLVKALAPLLPLIAKLVASVGKAFYGAIQQLLPVVAKLIDSLVKALAPVLPVIVKAIADVFNAVEPLIPIVLQLVEAMGPSLGDVIKALAPALGDIAKAMGDLLVALLPILVPILKLATILIVKIGAPILVKIAQAVGWLATALAKIVEVVAKVVTAITHLDFGALTSAVGNAAGAVLGFITDLPAKIGRAAVGLFKAVVDEAQKLPGQVASFIGQIPGKLGDIAGELLLRAADLGVKIVTGLVSGLGGLAEKAGTLAGTMLDTVKDLGKSIINGVIDALNDLLPNSVGKVTVAGFTIFPGLDLPNNPIPRLARGGVLKAQPGGVLANIAEAGRDEAVLPLHRGVLEGLARIGQGAVAPGQGGWHVGQIVVPERDNPVQHAFDILDRLDAERYLQAAV